MSALKMYLEQIQAEIGIRRIRKLQALRWYLKISKEEDLKKIIDTLTDQQQLKILWECGLTSPLQEVVGRRLRELTERRR